METVPMHRQLYGALRHAILDGRLTPGSCLPPSRNLSETLCLSRTVVVNAYEQLTVEGYLTAQVGAGTFVAEVLGQRERVVPQHIAPVHLSGRGERLAAAGGALTHTAQPIGAFRPGISAIDTFPFDVWGRLLSKSVREASGDVWSYGDAGGYLPLRQAIAAYLGASRGVRCEAEQVIIVSGTQQAIDLSTRLLLDVGDPVWCEDPGYPAACAAFRGAGAKILPVPVDEHGFDIEAAIERTGTARMVYLTPSHQYPLTATMPIARRLRVIEWASASNAWILEDDYDSEFRYESSPIPALQGLDAAGRVLYLGTFSKVLFPALRLGYMVVPPGLVEPFCALRVLADRCPPAANQVALARFISEGHFARHLRRMRSLYAERRKVLLATCKTKLEGLLTIQPSQAGMHVVGFLAPGLSDRVASDRAAQFGIIAPPLSSYYVSEQTRSGLVLGYASVPVQDIVPAVEQLKAALQSL